MQRQNITHNASCFESTDETWDNDVTFHLAHALLLQRLHVLLSRPLLLAALLLGLAVARVLALLGRLRAQTRLQLLPLLDAVRDLFGLR